MSRQIPPMPISPKLFRHFAIVTLGITACIALFADGEGRQAVEEQLAQREAETQLAVNEAKKLGARKMEMQGLKLRETRKAYLPFAQDVVDNDPGFGQPMERSSAGGGGSPRRAPGSYIQPNLEPGRGSNGIAEGSSDPNSPNGGEGKKRPPRASQPSQSQLDRLEAASRQRSGG